MRTKFFLQDGMLRWRILAQIGGWEITKPIEQKTRDFFLKFTPPYIPEDEPLIFDTPIGDHFFSPDARITQVTYQNKTLKSGRFIATDWRLLIYNVDKGLILQTPYERIKALYTDGGDFTLSLTDDTQILIRTKFPGPSLLGFMAIVSAPPSAKAFHADIERNKAKMGEFFVNAFTGFFTEIVDENRRRRGVR